MEKSLDCLSDLHKLHKEVMRNGVLKSTRASSLLSGQSIKDVILNKCYIPVFVSVDTRASLMCKTLKSVIAQEFGAGTEIGKLLLCGGPGMGKTTAVEQLIWDWASGIHLQHYTFLLRLCPSMLRGPEQSLQSMLLSEHTHLSAEQLEIILKTPHTILLVLDDIQDFLSNCPESGKLLHEPHQPAGGAILVHSLLQGSLLPGVALLLTSREAVEMESVHVANLMGFSSSQRKAFFQHFFENKDKGEQILNQCEQAVGVKEICACPRFCWTLCCVYKEQENWVPETLSELHCRIMHTLLQEHKVNVETAKQLICGLGKLAEQCTSFTCAHSDIVKCGLQPFLASRILSAILHVNADDPTSPGATFSFMLPTFQDFLRAVAFYLDHDDSRLLEQPMEIHNYHLLLAGLSDPAQRKLLETSVGRFSSGRLSEFHSWLMKSVAEVLPGTEKTNHWHVLRILYHTLSPTLVRESVGLCKWRKICYSDLQEADCAALAFVVRCLGELEELNLNSSSLTEEQAEKLGTVFRLAKSINFRYSTVSLDVMIHFARGLKDGRATDLNLTNCNLGDEAIKILCSAIPHSSLHTLSMNACELTEPVFSALGSVLMCGTSRLKELQIGVNKVGDAAVKHIWKALKHPHCQLQHLDVEMANLTDASVDELCEAVTVCGSIRSLILKNNQFTDISVPRLIKLVQDCPGLELNVQYNDFSEDVFELMDVYETIRY
ncbi:NACHT, LRR and PYD domains-containing protein 9 isoform X2 [Silurus meridionalis]|uniref:NACHT, LRR and PYD domains-containing protein 9 isoform X2 n=1 Tax=Silurus meridionalis TaxID=175797 RepID=UPI001EEB9CA6|nr:NACHT, LRR and PYD domains-containing protein 9 isoform X2 [Silurus meridionalis]